MLIVTIDSGTTNTRVRVWRDDALLASAREPVGVRDIALTQRRDTLLKAIKKARDTVFGQIGSTAEEGYVMVASGMLTAEIGLHTVPHLLTPVCFDDLVEGAVSCVLPEIDTQPVWFIPGVKNRMSDVSVHNIDAMDMMRGEEVETFGLLTQQRIPGPALIVLPGTHTKFVMVDQQQRIASCMTTMAGEFLDVLTHQTLLKQALNGRFTGELDSEYLLSGAAACQRLGIGRSCFSVRLLDRFTSASHSQKASYLLGAVFSSDLLALRHSTAMAFTPGMPIFISGKPILQQALAALIAADPFFTGPLTVIEEDPLRPLSGIGAVAVMQHILQRAVTPPPFSSNHSHQEFPS